MYVYVYASDVRYRTLYIAYHDYWTPNLSQYDNNHDITHHLCVWHNA